MTAAKACFPLLGESPSIDLVNTRVIKHGQPVDLLPTTAALYAWRRLQAPGPLWSWRPDADDLAALHTLRDTLDTLLRTRINGGTPPRKAVVAFNRALTGLMPDAHLAWDAAGPRRVSRRMDRATRRQHLVSRLAHDALAILTGPDADRLRQCAHPDCILLFIARHPQRRWCSADVCGNRARVARHYQQHKDIHA
ncbi:MAG TPA: ABATE domain-containing protein [Rhodanobacteraceae bacterium]